MKGYILAGLVSLASIIYDNESSKYSYVKIPEISIEESIISQALSIRAQEIENKTGIYFNNNRLIDVRIADISYRNQNPIGMYKPEIGRILFSSSILQELNISLDKPVRLANPKEVSEDVNLQEILDHELGHKLSDIISRKNGLGPWFTEEYFSKLKQPEALGLNIVSEGIGRWVQYTMNPPEGEHTKKIFPKTYDEARFYTYDIVAYEGGYFIVKDILDRYGEKGLVWMIKNPLSINIENMRKDAVEYRNKALLELGKN